MAVVTEYSDEYEQAYITSGGDKLTTDEIHGRVRVAFFTHTQAATGDAGSSVAIAKLPQGRVRLLASQSKAYVNWTTASATLDLGWDAYVDFAGDAVAADVDGIDDGLDVDTVGFQTFGNVAAVLLTGGTVKFESQNGVVIRATSITATVIGDDLVGYLLYVQD